MTEETSTTILTSDDLDYIPFALPGAKNVAFKVLKADEEQKRAILQVKFDAGAVVPRHYHHCRAIAYTISGEWEYDNGDFRPGDIAYEDIGEEHTPSSKTGAEMIIVFDADDENFLDNYMPDGGVITLGMKFMKAFERISAEDAAKLDVLSLVDIKPAAAA